MNMKRLLALVAFFATLQASAQQVNPVPDYVFANRMSAGRNTVTDTAAYFSIGPRYGATRGMMPPMVVDTASFSANKRNGLLIFSVQKNKFLYWDSVGVKWAEMAGTGGSAITGSGVAGYMPEFTTTTNIDTTRLYHSAGRFAIGGTTVTNGVLNVYGGQSYFDTTIKIGSSTFLADEGKNEIYIATTADSGSFPLQVNGSLFSNKSLYLSGVRKWELTAGETSSLELINRNLNVRSAIFDTNRNAAFGAISSEMGADASLYVNGNAKEVYINSTTDVGDYKLQINGNIYNSGSAAFAASSGSIGIGTTSPAFKLDVNGDARINSNLRINSTAGFNSLFTIPSGGGGIALVSTTDPGSSGLRLYSLGFGSVTYPAQARIQAFSTEAWSSTNRGTSIGIFTTANGTTSIVERLLVDQNGEVRINTTDVGNYILQVGGDFYSTSSITTGSPSGGTQKPWKIGEAATVSPTSPNRTLRVEVDGVVYYIHAKTTND